MKTFNNFFFLIAVVIICSCVALSSSISAKSSPIVLDSLINNNKHHHQFNSQEQQTALDKYVQADDKYFSWKRVADDVKNNSAYTLSFFSMVSQKWLTENDTDKSIWRHQLIVVRPTDMDPSNTNAFLWITGGNDKSNKTVPAWDPHNFMADLDLTVTVTAAVNARALGFILDQVPDQPICFYRDNEAPVCGSEDKAVGYSFEQFFLYNKSIEHALLFPMTKAGIKAMDAGEQIAEQIFGLTIKSWIVSGASKRGWTTWLVGATDPKRYQRIKAIVPVVLDAINFADFLKREIQSYKQAISWVAAPYRVLAAFVNTSAFEYWSQNIDPYFLRDRLTMTKFAINAVGDEFQQLDDQLSWLHDMPSTPAAPMLNLVAYDCDHPLLPNLPLPLEAITGFAQSLYANSSFPQYTWTQDQTTGQISVTTNIAPKEVKVYYATTPKSSEGRRDFRNTILKEDPCIIKLLGGCLRFIPWSHMDAVMHSPTSFSTNVPNPEEGLYTGFLIQMKFSNIGPNGEKLADFIFSTPATVAPFNVFPTDGIQCKGLQCLNLPLV